MSLRSDVEALAEFFELFPNATTPDASVAMRIREMLDAHPEDKAAMWEWCAKGFNFPFYMGPTV